MIKAFFIGGQSNAVGWTTPPSLLPSVYKVENTNIKFYDGGTNTFKNLYPATNPFNYNGSTNNSFSFDLEFSLSLYNQYPDDDIYIIKYAVGGDSISTLLNPTKSLFTSGKNKLDTIGNYELEGFLWYQGESDQDTQSEVDTYAGKLDEIVDHCETLAGNTTTFKNLIVRPANMDCTLFRQCPGYENASPYQTEWNTMISNYCSGDTYKILINTDDLEVPNGVCNRIHLHGNGYLKLGKRMFNAYMNIDNTNRKYKSLGGKVIKIGNNYRTIKPDLFYTDESFTRVDETTFTPDC